MNSQMMYTAWNDYYKGIKTLDKKNTQNNYINYLENLVNMIKSDPSIRIKKENQKESFSGKCLKVENERKDLGCIITVPMTEKLEKFKLTEQLKYILEKNEKIILSNYYEFSLITLNGTTQTASLTNLFELDNKNSEMNLENMEQVNHLFDELLSN